MEPNAAGVGTPIDTEYFKELLEICKENNILTIGDSVMGGWKGQIGGTFEKFTGLLPDLEIYGKALGGGVCPVAILAGRDEYMKLFTEK